METQMRKAAAISMLLLLAICLITTPYAFRPQVQLVCFELRATQKATECPPPYDDSMTNKHYKFEPSKWYVTCEYWINPSNTYGLEEAVVITAFTAAADAWDRETAFSVFAYQGTTTLLAGAYDGVNVISWGNYGDPNVIAVAYIWYIWEGFMHSKNLESDILLNTAWPWDVTGALDKMDVQAVATHEFGHVVGLWDLYACYDYWLTMYGYSNLGITYQRTLGLGDIKGLERLYGK